MRHDRSTGFFKMIHHFQDKQHPQNRVNSVSVVDISLGTSSIKRRIRVAYRVHFKGFESYSIVDFTE